MHAGTVPPIIGVGGSEHEIAEVRRFLQTISPGCGASYVVILNIDPAAESESVVALASSCRVPVTAPVDASPTDCACEAGHVYVTSSHSLPRIEAGCLRFGKRDDARAHRAPMDQFLVSLAEDQEDNAACIILSGTGGDATLGVRAIKLYGGIVLAQSDAQSVAAMRSSPATALADLAMPINAIVPRLQAHFAHRGLLVANDARAAIRTDVGANVTEFCDILRVRTGHDFSGFKSGAITRQVQRRMHLRQLADTDAFLALLKADPSEADRLFHDLLIGMTEFFDSRDAFETLAREVIPRIMEGKGPGDAVRVWVPGCGTGEEAYAIAMLLCEQVDDAGPQIQVFASDIDDQSLALARTGRYPRSVEEFVSEARLSRFFVREEGTYRVNSALRDKCLFTKHDLLRDPPFSRIDLLVCRNLLIHIDSELQKQIVAVLHYAMREGGYLFLGESENVTDATFFDTVDPAHRIFRKRQCGRIRLPQFPLASRAPARHEAGPRSSVAKGRLVALAEQHVLEQFGPAHVIIDSAGEIIHTSGRTSNFFEMPAGPPDNSIISLARHDLRPALRAAFHEATTNQSTVVARNLVLHSAAGRSIIDLIIQPVDANETLERTYLVVFRDVGRAAVETHIDVLLEAGKRESEESAARENANIRQLELEARESREHLHATKEELEASNEELRSTNEEMSSLNEELQSVNAELNVRVDELSAAMNDVANLLESTRIATIFLDRSFRLRFFTPAACDLYHLEASDLGRPIANLRPRFACDSLLTEAAEVLRTLVPVERRIDGIEDGSVHVMRILPYRTADDVIDGVVLTFVEAKSVSSLR